MTRDDIIRMAREAGFPMAWISDSGVLTWTDLEKFAALVVAAEREACAKVCDEMEASPALSDIEKYRTRFISDAIRARGHE
jgi:hypothetical protein